ncbi:MurT ligase domain-containing protein [Amedibacillus sp. YH-ame10]
MKIIAITMTKISSFLLKLIKRGGSLPGQIALKVCPTILDQLQTNCPLILVTGTNGKTSTANMITETFLHANKHVISNRKGDNLRPGIVTTLLTNATLGGKVKAEAIVLEVDELNIPYIIKSLKVDALVVTNFFRDQLDRAREMEQLIQRMEQSLDTFEGTLVLNANDPNVVRLKDSAPLAKELYYGIERCESSVLESREASEGKFCPRCGSRLQYSFYQYSHIGEFQCTKCDFKTPNMEVKGEVKSIPQRQFIYEQQTYRAPQGGLYTMYNCMAVLCACKLFSIDPQYAKKAFENIKVPAGRNEILEINGHTCTLNLIKNPTGANEVMKVIEEDESEKTILLVLNDNDQDGTDISWIYDTFFEKLLNQRTKHIIVSGTRCYDMALRLKYSGYEETIELHESLQDAVTSLLNANGTMYAIATYTALQPVRNLIVANVK